MNEKATGVRCQRKDFFLPPKTERLFPLLKQGFFSPAQDRKKFSSATICLFFKISHKIEDQVAADAYQIKHIFGCFVQSFLVFFRLSDVAPVSFAFFSCGRKKHHSIIFSIFGVKNRAPGWGKERMRKGWRKGEEGFRKGWGRVEEGVRKGWGEVQEGLRKGSGRGEEGFRKGWGKVKGKGLKARFKGWNLG